MAKALKIFDALLLEDRQLTESDNEKKEHLGS